MPDLPPLMSCTQDGKPGYRWAVSGRCWTYDPDDPASEAQAREAAEAQGREVMERQMAVDKIKSQEY